MVRGLLWCLALANLLFFAWTQGWLGDLGGFSPLGEREPQRLEMQINPNNLRVLPPTAPAAASSSSTSSAAETAPDAVVCLEAGPFTSPELEAAETAARAVLPPGSWSVLRRDKPGSWLVYMGRFANRDQQQKKIAELKRLNVNFDEVDSPATREANLEPGLSFGRFSRLEDAQNLMRRLENQRVRTARIVTLVAPVSSAMLRIPKADGELQTAALGLRDAFKGKSFSACARA